MKKDFLRIVLLSVIALGGFAANAATYLSTGAGAWTTASNWSPNGVPGNGDVVTIATAITRAGFTATDWGSGSITINNLGSLTITGNLSLAGSGFKVTVNTGGKLDVSGSLTMNNQSSLKIVGGTLKAGAFTVDGATFDNGTGSTATLASVYSSNSGGTDFSNTGVIDVTGAVDAYGYIRLYPGTNSIMTVGTTLTVDANPYMVVGTLVSPTCATVITQYANLLVKGNVKLNGSGDVTVNQNGRFVVYGNVTTNGTGNLITLNCGAQAYVHGNINIGTGGGNTVTNSNSSSSPVGTNNQPVIGLYVNGTVTAQTVAGTVGNKTQLFDNDRPFFQFIAGLPNSPLPVKIQYFKVASVTEQGIALEWATSMERNFSHFEVQSAGTDLKFNTVGIVQGRGGLQVKTVYDWLDQSPVNGKNYYRLKAVDFDNTSEYFAVIVEDWNGDPRRVTLYPNPAVDHSFTLDLGDEFGQTVSLVVFESKGTVVHSQQLATKTSSVSLPESVAAGVYFVKVTSQSTQQVVRLVVK